MTPRLLITGTGRCGTGYIAEVLTLAGVQCGHEWWWNPHGVQKPCIADASWCALAIGVPRDVTVAHQVRHPLDVVSSLAKQPTHDDYRDLQVTLMPWDPWDPIEWAMLATHTYLDAAEHRSALTYRLEDVDSHIVQQLAAIVGIDLDENSARRAVEAVPRDVNWHGAGPRYEWVDLPAGGLRDALMAWAKRWGWS